MALVKVWSRRTGRLHRVPSHYLDNPHLMKPFRKSPPTDGGVDEDESPSTDWTIQRLRDHAAHQSPPVDLTGAGRSKADIVTRLAEAAHPMPTPDPSVAVLNESDLPDDTVSPGQPPAEGE